MFPPELVELIVYHGWGCLSTSSHRHAYSMAHWMLVSHDWLKIVLSVVFRDLWVTSIAHINYVIGICDSNESFICQLAGISDVHRHLAQTCHSLTISVYHSYAGQYASQCAELMGYATTNPHRDQLLPGYGHYESQRYAIPTRSIATVVRVFTPRITALHFVLIDCAATYGAWDTHPIIPCPMATEYPLSLVELHVTFAYTSPPPALLLDAPRGTFFPPPFYGDLPIRCCFDGVTKLVVRDANADFVAFLTTACPRLERIESTAEFLAEDVPQRVPADVKARLVFVRLPRTTTWGLTGSDAMPQQASVQKRRNSIWRFLKHVFRERK
ncbi:hypothetical protein DFH07DRAFT_829734 [Mycena maculata]|uniref:Uncharacterized protein n=1 Tax=Mycena maculata TaxID=230809 RepID=A0AAD7IRK5_9AGAR|nr:hypothetical protein DFH07DRAFT_829734 [Mycena maculata]